MIEIQQFTFGPLQENTFLLINGKKECIIIDPGCYFQDERKELLQYIQTHGLNVIRLLNTHCHFDHIFGNKLIADTYKVRPEFHELEQPVLDNSQRAFSEDKLPNKVMLRSTLDWTFSISALIACVWLMRMAYSSL